MPAVINRDDVEPSEGSAGEIRFQRRRLAAASGATGIGCSLYEVPPGARQMPVHRHGDEEEIIYVLGGGGLSWQRDSACSIGPGDTIVHRERAETHTLLAGDDGLEVLIFGSGSDTDITYLPRAKVMWCGPRWVPVDAAHPFLAEAEAGPLPRPEPGERPDNVLATEAAVAATRGGGVVRELGRTAGSIRAGLNHVILGAGAGGAPHHCHALEEELFYVLDGSGTLRLGEHDEHPLRPGDVVARPPSTGVAHSIVAGGDGITYLAYGTRVPGDSVYYPELGKVRLRGLGVTIDVT